MTEPHPIQTVLPDIVPVSSLALREARTLVDALAKPPGSLGRVEDLAVRLAGIAGRCPPPVPAAPAALVFAADHGVVRHGVTRWPAEVTAAMVSQILDGRAACNAIARAVGATVRVVDVGVATPIDEHPGLTRAGDGRGTDDMLDGPAMDPARAARAVEAGAEEARRALAEGADLLCPGDMGIGNTTAAAALIARVTGRPPAAVVGAGAAADRDTVTSKREVVARALELHRSPDPADALCALGGLEHAAMAGAMVEGARARVAVVVDGVNAVAAALVAVALRPDAAGYLVAGHLSREPGATAGLEHLRLVPLLDLDMALGEATGALLAVPVICAAARIAREMARLDEVAG